MEEGSPLSACTPAFGAQEWLLGRLLQLAGARPGPQFLDLAWRTGDAPRVVARALEAAAEWDELGGADLVPHAVHVAAEGAGEAEQESTPPGARLACVAWAVRPQEIHRNAHSRALYVTSPSVGTFEAASFAAVTLRNALEFFPYAAPALQEVGRVLQPAGAVALSSTGGQEHPLARLALAARGELGGDVEAPRALEALEERGAEVEAALAEAGFVSCAHATFVTALRCATTGELLAALRAVPEGAAAAEYAASEGPGAVRDLEEGAAAAAEPYRDASAGGWTVPFPVAVAWGFKPGEASSAGGEAGPTS